MQFVCNQKELCNAIARVSRGVSPKSPIPALEGICIQVEAEKRRIILTGYDLEIGIRTSIPVETNDTFSCVLNARLFNDMTRHLSGENVCIEIDDAMNVRLSSDDTQYRMSAMSAEEFPALPVVETTAQTSIAQNVLRSMIQQSSFAASVKDDKPILTGELFQAEGGTFFVVAMDRFRLAMRQEEIGEIEDFRFVVPKKALSELISLLSDNAKNPCTFATNGKHIVFSVDGFELFARLLEGQFHNFRNSIPDSGKTTVTVKTGDLIRCVERCSLLINEKNKAPMRCVFSDGFVEISCQTAIGAVNDRIPAEINGESITIGLSNRYLLEALRVCDCDQICLHMSGSNKVVKMTPRDGESFIYLIMPIQLKN